MLHEVALHYILGKFMLEGECYSLGGKIYYYVHLDLIPTKLITDLDDLVDMLSRYIKKKHPNVKIRMMGMRLQIEMRMNNNIPEEKLDGPRCFHIFGDILKDIFIALLERLYLVDDVEKEFCRNMIDRVIRFFGGLRASRK